MRGNTPFRGSCARSVWHGLRERERGTGLLYAHKHCLRRRTKQVWWVSEGKEPTKTRASLVAARRLSFLESDHCATRHSSELVQRRCCRMPCARLHLAYGKSNGHPIPRGRDSSRGPRPPVPPLYPRTCSMHPCSMHPVPCTFKSRVTARAGEPRYRRAEIPPSETPIVRSPERRARALPHAALQGSARHWRGAHAFLPTLLRLSPRMSIARVIGGTARHGYGLRQHLTVQ